MNGATAPGARGRFTGLSLPTLLPALLPAALVALAVHARWPVAIGVGLAAGLSLAGSV